MGYETLMLGNIFSGVPVARLVESVGDPLVQEEVVEGQRPIKDALRQKFHPLHVLRVLSKPGLSKGPQPADDAVAPYSTDNCW